MKRVIFIMVLMIGLMACKHEPTNNFPPDDPEVELTSTNLPIVWIEVNGRMIQRYERVNARMKIIDNGKGQLNYADLDKHPGQHIDYEGFVACATVAIQPITTVQRNLILSAPWTAP